MTNPPNNQPDTLPTSTEATRVVSGGVQGTITISRSLAAPGRRERWEARLRTGSESIAFYGYSPAQAEAALRSHRDCTGIEATVDYRPLKALTVAKVGYRKMERDAWASEDCRVVAGGAK